MVATVEAVEAVVAAVTNLLPAGEASNAGAPEQAAAALGTSAAVPTCVAWQTDLPCHVGVDEVKPHSPRGCVARHA